LSERVCVLAYDYHNGYFVSFEEGTETAPLVDAGSDVGGSS